MKKIVCILLCMCMMATLCACAGSYRKDGADAVKGDAGYDGDYNGGDWVVEDSAYPEEEPAMPDIDTGEGGSESQSQTLRPAAGMITAGAHNDNDYYDGWLELFAEDGKYGYGSYADWHFDTLQRVKVTVKNGETALAGEKVTLQSANGQIVGSAVTDANGVAYLFVPSSEDGVTVHFGEDKQTLMQNTTEVTFDVAKENQKKNTIELMLVVDVTGSMGDELIFLQKELADVIERVEKDNANAELRLSLLFYRDHGDSEVFSFCDFATLKKDVMGMAKLLNTLAGQRADGGGDTPEAVDEALQMAMNASWSQDATTKIIFHVLDAPPHSKTENKDTYFAAVQSAAEQGIRICPVICSGADSLTEYLCRQTAIYTGGTFVFVTNDSGIGNAHHDPGLPNVTVEYLNDLMVRLVNGYHSGVFEKPVSWKEAGKQ